MNIRQEQTIKATEVSSTMQCKVDGDIWKRVVVGFGREEVAEPADGIPESKLWRVQWCMCVSTLPWDSSDKERELSSILAEFLTTESDKWHHLVRATTVEQQERRMLVVVTTVIHLRGVRIV